MMTIGILGTGVVARTLGQALVVLGHQVRMGSRSANNEHALAWARACGIKASVGTFADAAASGELIILATLGTANESALRLAGAEKMRGKVVIDTTNPLDISRGPTGVTLAIRGDDSAGEQVQRQLPDALVVKAFNTVGHALMFRPQLAGGPPDMPICGNDERAKQQVAELVKACGWGVIDVGGIDAARYLEAMCIVWVRYGSLSQSWNHAFKLIGDGRRL